jgi:hypothetical protein
MPRDVARADSVDVGYDDRFERTWWRVQRATFVVLALFVAAGIAGLFGRGPLSKKTVQTEGLKIQYERFARFRTSAVMRISVDRALAQNGRVNLFVSQAVVDTLSISQTTPSPVATAITGDGEVFTFDVADGSPLLFKFSQEPSTFGIVSGRIGVPAAAQLDIKQIVYP